MSGSVEIMSSPGSSPKEGAFFPDYFEEQFSNLELGPREYKILVAEDNVVILKLLQRLVIEKSSHKIEIAENGQIAVEMARETKYDLIFMDHNMPEKGGVEATREIRAETCNKETPIVVQSDQRLSFLKTEFEKYSVYDYLEGREAGKGGKLTKVEQLDGIIARLQNEGKL